MMLRRFGIFLALLGALVITDVVYAQTAAAPAQEQPKPAAAPAPAKNDYSNGDNWLCRPGRQDACAVDLTTTVVTVDGKLAREAWAANPKAPIDCFYVYPTVSNDPAGNRDMIPGPREKVAIRAPIAR